MPFGMICQSASKYRLSATVVLCETAIAALQHVEPLLEEPAAERVAERPVEIRVERADDRTVRLLDREDRQDRRERRVDVDDVVPALAQHAAHVACGDSSPSVMRACEPLAYTGWLRPRRMTCGCASAPGNVRRDDVDVMAAAPRLAREEMHVLADPAEVRIVVLRDQRDAERPLVAA